MDEDLSSLKQSSSKRKQNTYLDEEESQSSKLQSGDVEDECAIFGKLVAAKMRRLDEKRKDLMMIKISQLFYDEHDEANRPDSSASSEVYS